MALCVFNVTNAYIDAYKIKLALKDNVAKAIKHGINFAAYTVCTGLCVWIFKLHSWHIIVYSVCAFFCRQVTFDIPLNWRRGLAWDYVSLDKPPKAIMDQIEVKLFGYNGRAPTLAYGALWLILLTVQFLIK